MKDSTNNRPTPFGKLTTKQLKALTERSIAHLLVVILECLTPVRNSAYRRERAQWEIEQCVNILDEALRKMRG